MRVQWHEIFGPVLEIVLPVSSFPRIILSAEGTKQSSGRITVSTNSLQAELLKSTNSLQV
jgi:hypothetical protein